MGRGRRGRRGRGGHGNHTPGPQASQETQIQKTQIQETDSQGPHNQGITRSPESEDQKKQKKGTLHIK